MVCFSFVRLPLIEKVFYRFPEFSIHYGSSLLLDIGKIAALLSVLLRRRSRAFHAIQSAINEQCNQIWTNMLEPQIS